ncbi:ATP-dependent DNA helicase PIF1-like [Aphis craccivora]|uniref:ATP-dependent DNA helicase PIF1-like n=1 Tax=Aphis craccivora TaxID=307492 RepID=A0A6G0W1C5_APHCR|nr:ATP-dependent DNA helicase PIF1-like [Aphis craccivora]
MVVECELVVAGQLFLYAKAFVITVCARGDIVIIPRITLIQTDYPFEFKIIQFPLKVCFAMTINNMDFQRTIIEHGRDWLERRIPLCKIMFQLHKNKVPEKH